MIEGLVARRKAEAILVSQLKHQLPHRVTRMVGFRGGNQLSKLCHDNTFWFSTRRGNSGASNAEVAWNSFGFLTRKLLHITVEINILVDSDAHTYAGFFATDSETGRTYLMHSGAIGGGKPGVGQMEFLTWSNLRTRTVLQSSGRTREGVVVGAIDGANILERVYAFTSKVRDFKNEASAGSVLQKSSFQRKLKRRRTYKDEFAGRKRGMRSAVAIDYESYHGDVVSALEAEMTSAGYRVQNLPEDLFASKAGSQSILFEVKTSTSTGAIYAAIGQLMVYGNIDKRSNGPLKRVLVLPEDDQSIYGEIAEALRTLNIKLRRFRRVSSGGVQLLSEVSA
jgi:hypothetical protein